MKRDSEKTLAAGFKDKRSFVRADGREVLFGKDWAKRKAELWERCGGRCEFTVPGFVVRCGTEADDPHHIIPRGKGRDDRLNNLQALCRFHHRLVDPRQIRWSKREKA